MSKNFKTNMVGKMIKFANVPHTRKGWESQHLPDRFGEIVSAYLFEDLPVFDVQLLYSQEVEHCTYDGEYGPQTGYKDKLEAGKIISGVSADSFIVRSRRD